MNTIFISHSSKDNSIAGELNRHLEIQGHRSIFLDFDPELGIPPGRNWEHELYRQLRNCQAVIVLCSEHSMSSRWCFAEIIHAKSLGKHVFPVKVGPCTIDPVLTSRQVLDLTQDPEDAYQRLWRGLKVAGLDPADSFDWDDSRSPYPGMMAFQEADAAVFFGRETEIQHILETLQRLRQFGGARMLLVHGASGSGKSSIVRAGLLPRLRRNKEYWLIIDPFRPQEHPLRELSIVLSDALSEIGRKESREQVCEQLEQAAKKEKLQEKTILNDMALDLQIAQKRRDAATLLIIDQAEELLVRSKQELTVSFLSLLRSALEAPDSPLMAIFTLRSDFLSDFQRMSELMGLPCEQFSIGPMASDRISKIIEGPAEIAGIEIEDGLTQAMVRDTKSQDALPLLAFTLRELYKKYGDDKLLKVDEYQNKLGGLNGAVSNAADAVLSAAQLSIDQEEALRNALVSLARINEAGQFTRKPVRWSDLPESVHDVLERFVKARLLTSRGERKERLLEVAHEALFHSWERLKKWLDEDREFLLWRKRFREARQEWLRIGRDPGALLTGSSLNEGQSWIKRRGEQFTTEENEYLDESVLLAKKRRNRRLGAFAGLVVFLIAVAIGGGVLWQRAEKERKNAQNHLAKYYWANSLDSRDKNNYFGLLHYAALTGEIATMPSYIKNSAFIISNYMSIYSNAILKHNSFVNGAMFNHDGTRILTWSKNGTARLWDASDGNSIGRAMKHDSDVIGAVFNHDESRILSWSKDGTARLWDASDGAPFGHVMKHDRDSIGAVFNQNDTRILTWSADGTARLWDARDGSAIGQPMMHESAVFAWFNQKGTRVLTSGIDGKVQLWDARDGSAIGQPMMHESAAFALFNHDETQILTYSRDGARLWDAIDGSPIGEPMMPLGLVVDVVLNQDDTLILTRSLNGSVCLWNANNGIPFGKPMVAASHVYGAVFNHNETRILTWSEDGAARLWDARDGSAIGQPMMHERAVYGAVFNQNDTRILTWSEDGTARLWDARDGSAIGQPMMHESAVYGAVFNHDGTRILTWGDDGTARLWNIFGSVNIDQAMKHGSDVNGAEFFQNGTRILTMSWDGTARLWDARDGTPIGQRMKHDSAVNGAVLNQNETRILTWSGDGKARLWDARDGTPIGQRMKHDSAVNGAVLNQNETRILTWSGDGKARLWDARNGAPIGQPMEHDIYINGAMFNHDGTRILTWSWDKTARMWDASDSAPIGQPMNHDMIIIGAMFNYGGTLILTWSMDGTARLWDVRDGTPIGKPMEHEYHVYSAVFNHDDTRILTWSGDGTARLWDARDGAPIGQPMKYGGSISLDPNNNFSTAVFNHDDTQILTWSLDLEYTAQLWDTHDGNAIGHPMKHDSSVRGAVFNQNDTRILTWSEDGTARLWDARDGSAIGQPMMHERTVYGAVFNQNDTRILTWSEDGTARLWDACDGTPIGYPLKHDSAISGAVLNQNENRILTWSVNGSASLWNIEVDEDFPKESLPLLVKVATGTTMDDYGKITILSKRKWEELRAEYIHIAEKHIKNCKHKNANIYLNCQKPNWGKNDWYR